MSATPASTPAPVATSTPASTNAPGKPGAPVISPPPAPIDDYYVRYGKILSPNNQPLYPFKLNMPFPGVGEVKVPSREELDMREKLEPLTTMSDAEIRDQLEKWPAFGEMSLADEGAMLTRIQTFRDYRHKKAIDVAHKLGLLNLNPAQMARFEKEYWDKKIKMDRQLAQQLQGAYSAAQQKFDADLYREFSSPTPIAQSKPPAPPAPKPPPKPAVPPASTASTTNPPTGPALAH
jgi:hypothetical protein